MEFIIKKIKNLKQGESWDYGNGFVVTRISGGWKIDKHRLHVVTNHDINAIAKEIKLTFIAIEVTNSVTSEIKEDGEKE